MESAMKTQLPIAFAVCLVAASAPGVEPPGAELTLEQTRVEFSGGPNPAVYPISLLGSGRCPPAGPVCEEFFLTTDLPANLAARYPAATLEWRVGWVATGIDDYDIFLYDDQGYEWDQSATTSNPEKMSIAAEPGVHTYRLVIIPFSVLTSPYSGYVELVTGAGAKSGTAAGPVAAGALGPGLLALGLLALWRRLRPRARG
jgi:hypothetical protein